MIRSVNVCIIPFPISQTNVSKMRVNLENVVVSQKRNQTTDEYVFLKLFITLVIIKKLLLGQML